MRDKYRFVPAPNVPLTHAGICQSLIDLFDTNKRSRKRLSDQATQDVLNELQLELAKAAPNVHSVLHEYEKRHLSIGNWHTLSNSMRLRFQNKVELQRIGDSVNVFATIGTHRAKVGMIFLEDTRFIRAPGIPAVNGKDIYIRRNDPNGRQYIYVRHSDSFVRRYVTRGLNGFDGMRLSQGQPLLAVVQTNQAQASEIGGPRHGVAANTALSEQQQILSHTRGWGGNKRYISTGVSNRPALSTRGQPFQSIYGAVTVDLAHVPDAQIFDLHTPKTADLNFSDPAFQAHAQDVMNNPHHTGTNDIAEQAYLGMRDVLRTRELLIKGNLPVAAICSNSLGSQLLGIGSQSNGEHNGVVAQVNHLPAVCRNAIVAQDHLTFRDPHTNNRRWHFIEFQNAALAQLAYNSFALAGAQIKVRFHKYQPTRPPGMV